MGFRVNVYLREASEREIIKVALAIHRAKVSGLSDEDIQETVGAVVDLANDPAPIEDSLTALPSNTDREIPHTLQRFIDEGWDLDTAFRIYDEWKAEINSSSGDVYVKSLNQRFMEERMKRDADESA